jgi:hypothetical protein
MQAEYGADYNGPPHISHFRFGHFPNLVRGLRSNGPKADKFSDCSHLAICLPFRALASDLPPYSTGWPQRPVALALAVSRNLSSRPVVHAAPHTQCCGTPSLVDGLLPICYSRVASVCCAIDCAEPPSSGMIEQLHQPGCVLLPWWLQVGRSSPTRLMRTAFQVIRIACGQARSRVACCCPGARHIAMSDNEATSG